MYGMAVWRAHREGQPKGFGRRRLTQPGHVGRHVLGRLIPAWLMPQEGRGRGEEGGPLGVCAGHVHGAGVQERGAGAPVLLVHEQALRGWHSSTGGGEAAVRVANVLHAGVAFKLGLCVQGGAGMRTLRWAESAHAL